MHRFFRWLDEISDLQTESAAVLWLERGAFIFLILMTLAAPHSIAATQTAWLLGMLAWTIRIFLKPRPRFKVEPLDYALWAFFAWSVVSSVFSYAPDISIDKLRGVSLFLIFYFVYNNLRTKRAARFLAFALIFSCMAAVLWTPVERIVGRGVEVHGLSAESPLIKATPIDGQPISEGKTIVQVGKKKIRSPESLVAEIEKTETSRLTIYHTDFYSVIEVKRADLLNGASAAEKLGIIDWKRNHNWRAAGFYGHYTTFAEVLQLIISLTFGIFIALISKSKFFTPRHQGAREERKGEEERGRRGEGNNEIEASNLNPEINQNQRVKNKVRFLPFLPFSLSPFLPFSLAAMAFALLLTATRASQAAFLISAASIVLLSGNRKIILTLAAIILPLAMIGLVFLQQTRRIGFFDPQDNSTTWRQTVYREGFELWTSNARNFTVGVGMDSIKRYAREWHLFDDGRLPMGHFHSTPLQLAVERGLPALLLWLTILGIYARTLWRGFKVQSGESRVESRESGVETPNSKLQTPNSVDWQTRGIILGCFGGLIGFFTSGLVHYNLGDGEVAMVFYLLMGISVFLCKSALTTETKSGKLYT